METVPRPPLLTIGIVLHAVHAGLMVLLAGIGVLVAAGLLGAGFALPEALPAGLVVGLGSLVAVGFGLFYTFVLYVCARAWEGERPWIWGLIVMSVLGLASSGPLSAAVGVLTIVGAVQALTAAPKAA